MTKEQRIAISRIISDMIKADNIIEESEIRDMKALMAKYALTQKDMSEARVLKFSDAVTILQELGPQQRRNIFDSIYKIAMSDNVCVPKEALLLIALEYCLVRRDGAYLISCPTSEVSMNDQYMVYIESMCDRERNAEIQRDFELLVSRSRLSGFNFVYIPKMVEEFKNMDADYVCDVIKYMAPQLSDIVVHDVYCRLCNMSTSMFFKDVLYEKLQVKALHNAGPSLLINIGTSVVPYCSENGSVQYYTEFLCIPLTRSLLEVEKEVLDFYKSKVSLRTVTVTDNQGQFKYFGFYKALFDFLIAPPPISPDLVFLGQDVKTNRYRVVFKFDENRERELSMTPKRYLLFLHIAMSKSGVSVAQIDRTSISHIRSEIAECLLDVSYADQYKPERVGNSFVLKLDREKIFVREYNYSEGTHEDVKIDDSVPF